MIQLENKSQIIKNTRPGSFQITHFKQQKKKSKKPTTLNLINYIRRMTCNIMVWYIFYWCLKTNIII